jgi:hypothetical protein
VLQYMPFPFRDDEFPPELGAIIQSTVLSGERPALEVIHTPDGSWLVGDGVEDPNVPGACVAAHIVHVVAQNSSVSGLAAMPPGHWARRSRPGEPWTVYTLDDWEDE